MSQQFVITRRLEMEGSLYALFTLSQMLIATAIVYYLRVPLRSWRARARVPAACAAGSDGSAGAGATGRQRASDATPSSAPTLHATTTAIYYYTFTT